LNIIAKVLNFVLGLTAVMLILLGITTPEEPRRITMLAVGIGLFILALFIHMIQQMTNKAGKY